MSQGEIRVVSDDQYRDLVVRMSPRRLPNTYSFLSFPAHPTAGGLRQFSDSVKSTPLWRATL